MKIRNDFVTNSSSSSFIIGRQDDNSVTIESVYQKVREFYNDMYEQADKMFAYIESHPELGATHVRSDGFEYCRFSDKVYKNFDRASVRKIIEKEFGLSVWDYYPLDKEWLSLKTYKDYEKYWMGKMSKTDDYHVHAPFTIADFLEPKEVNWLHYRMDPKYAEYDESPEDRINYKSETLNWYYPYAEELIPDGIIPKPEKRFNSSSGLKEKVDFILPTHACLFLLGRVCVYSECGYISDYVVNRLIDISAFSCNHMG